MGAIDFLKDHGFVAKVKGNRLIVSPASQLTPDVRKYIKAHRLELIAEVAANDGLSRHCSWTVLVPGSQPFVMISPEPITHVEAVVDVLARWPSASIQD
jgi:hypothetical protein